MIDPPIRWGSWCPGCQAYDKCDCPTAMSLGWDPGWAIHLVWVRLVLKPMEVVDAEARFL